MTDEQRVVHIVAGAAPPVLRLGAFIDALYAEGWNPCVILTPTAAEWVNVDDLAAQTGKPVRVRRRLPGEVDPFPAPDAIVAAPLTFNTLNNWAAGSSHNHALGQLNRGIGLGVPIVAAPVISPLLRAHPAYEASMRTLIGAGVRMFKPDEVTVRRADGTVTAAWDLIIAALSRP